MHTFHADVVGSLLRPPELLTAREAHARGALDAAGLRAAEDRAVDAAVALQEAAGLPVVTDGEMRRLSFQSRLPESVEGFGDYDLDAFLWGEWHGADGVSDAALDRPPALGVVAPLRRIGYPSADDFTYLRDRTRAVPKVCLPSPSLWANFWSPERSRAAYADLDAFLADVARITREEVAECVRRGATYIQLDAPHYTALLDPRTAAFYAAQGWSREAWLSRGIALDNAVMDGFPGVTFGFHLCRGNQASRWLVSGGYDAIAKAVFQGVRAERLLLEYDDERSGSFEALRHVPADKMAVLGLVTTKTPREETSEALAARLREAARHLPLERLAISPQCGFATSVLGNRLSPADQARKLRVVAETAGRVWGD